MNMFEANRNLAFDESLNRTWTRPSARVAGTRMTSRRFGAPGISLGFLENSAKRGQVLQEARAHHDSEVLS